MVKKKDNRGGARKGAGAPITVYPYKRVGFSKKVPKEIRDLLHKIVDKEIKKFEDKNGYIVEKVKIQK